MRAMIFIGGEEGEGWSRWITWGWRGGSVLEHGQWGMGWDGQRCRGGCRTGARMKTPVKGVLGSRRPSISNGASNDSTYIVTMPEQTVSQLITTK